MHKSQAFAAFRTELVATLQADLKEELLPKYNSEVEDIRRTTETIRASRGDALADHHKRARILDLKTRQQDFIEGLNKEMRESLTTRIKEYGGVMEEKEKLLEAKFPDSSVARVPRALWIDYNQFDKV